MAKLDIKYPCGYEVAMRATFFDVGAFNVEFGGPCPLHGKNCPPKK